MYIHHLRRTTMGNGGSTSKRHSVKGVTPTAPPMKRTCGSGIKPEVYTMDIQKPTDVLRNVRVAKSRLPKKYITFD